MILPNPFEYPLKVLSVEILLNEFYNHVIYVYLKCLPYLLLKDLVYHPLICHVNILQPKRNDVLLVISMLGHECSLYTVGPEDMYMIIHGVHVHE